MISNVELKIFFSQKVKRCMCPKSYDELQITILKVFNLQDNYGSKIPNGNKLIDIQATYYDLINTNGLFTNQNPPIIMNMRLCNHSDYSPELSEQYDDMTLDGAFVLITNML